MRKLALIEPFGHPQGHTSNFVRFLDAYFEEKQLAEVYVYTTPELADKLDSSRCESFFKRIDGKTGFQIRISHLWTVVFNPINEKAVLFSSVEELSLFVFLIINRGKSVSAYFLNNYRGGVLRKLLLKLILPRMTNVFVYSEAQAAYLRKIHNKAEISVVPHYSLIDRPSTKRQPIQFNVSFIGGDQAYKRFGDFRLLVERLVLESNNSLRVGCFGDIKALAGSSISETCTVELGYISRNRYFEVISASDCVFLGHDNSFSLKVSGLAFDVLGAGCKLVCRNIPPFCELKELFPEKVFLFDLVELIDLSELLSFIRRESNTVDFGQFEENLHIILSKA